MDDARELLGAQTTNWTKSCVYQRRGAAMWSTGSTLCMFKRQPISDTWGVEKGHPYAKTKIPPLPPHYNSETLPATAAGSTRRFPSCFISSHRDEMRWDETRQAVTIMNEWKKGAGGREKRVNDIRILHAGRWRSFVDYHLSVTKHSFLSSNGREFRLRLFLNVLFLLVHVGVFSGFIKYHRQLVLKKVK